MIKQRILGYVAVLAFALTTSNTVLAQGENQFPLLIPQWAGGAPAAPTGNSQAMQNFAAQVASQVANPNQGAFQKLDSQLKGEMQEVSQMTQQLQSAQQANFLQSQAQQQNVGSAVVPTSHNGASASPAIPNQFGDFGQFGHFGQFNGVQRPQGMVPPTSSMSPTGPLSLPMTGANVAQSIQGHTIEAPMQGPANSYRPADGVMQGEGPRGMMVGPMTGPVTYPGGSIMSTQMPVGAPAMSGGCGCSSGGCSSGGCSSGCGCGTSGPIVPPMSQTSVMPPAIQQPTALFVPPPQQPTNADFWSTGATQQTCAPTDVWANYDCSKGPKMPAMPGGFGSRESCCGSLCGPNCGSRLWLRTEVLFGWLRGYDTPAFLTSNPRGTPVDAVGDLSDPSTSVLYGGYRFGQDVRIGGRITSGLWLDECRRYSIQFDVFGFGNDNEDINVSSFGDEILSRPFTNTAGGTPMPDGQVIAMAGLTNGQFIANTSGSIISASPAFRWNVKCCGDGCSADSCRFDMTAGYRFLEFDEAFRSREVLSPYGPTIVPGSTIALRDTIDTSNEFHGLEIGGILMRRRGRLTAEVGGTLAFGGLRKSATLDGSSTYFTPPNAETIYPGGFLVRPEDIGRLEDNEFAVMPQFRASLGYCVARNTQITIGYTFLFLDDVFRPDNFMTVGFDGTTLGANPSLSDPLPRRTFDKTGEMLLQAFTLGLTHNF